MDDYNDNDDSDIEATANFGGMDFKSIAVRCSACGALMAIKKWASDEKKTHVSHGICEKCAAERLGQISEQSD